MRKTTLILLGLFLLAFTVRLIIAFNTYVISSDGPLYIEAANYYYEGDIKSALNHPYHPFYPALMALLYWFIGNWEWAGMLVSIILGSLAIMPLYLVGLRLFNPTMAIISALIYAFHPDAARLSAGILTTGTFIFLLVTAIYCLLEALEGYRYRYFILAGISSLLAFLTRPDGIIILLVILGWVVLSKKRLFEKKSLALGGIILPWIMAALPYLWHIIKTTGAFSISRKLSLSTLTLKASIPQMFYIVAEDFIKAMNPWLLVLVIIGILVRKEALYQRETTSKEKRTAWIIWSMVLTYLLTLLVFAGIYQRISQRYTTPLVVIIIFWGAVGLYFLARWCQQIFGPKTNSTGWLVFVVMITLCSFSIFTFKSIGHERLDERKVGNWIRQNYQDKDKPLVFAHSSHRIPFYAGSKIINHYIGNQITELGVDYETIIKNARLQKADYLVISPDIKNSIPDFIPSIKPVDLELILEATTGDFSVYHLRK